MKITFDPAKDEWTKQMRGLSLLLAAEIIENAVFTEADQRFDYGETRMVAFGFVGQRLHVCVYTMRDETFHVISVRKANDREVKRHGR